jgi:hypothetical protein
VWTDCFEAADLVIHDRYIRVERVARWGSYYLEGAIVNDHVRVMPQASIPGGEEWNVGIRRNRSEASSERPFKAETISLYASARRTDDARAG